MIVKRSAVPLGLACTLLVGVDAFSQSLGELAARERARRERARSRAPVRVIDAEALSRAGEGAEPRSPESAERDDAGAGSDPAPSTAPAADAPDRPRPRLTLTDREVRDLRAQWAAVWVEQMEHARRELAEAEDVFDQCRAAAHYVFVPLAIDCNGASERLAIAEFRLRQTRQNRYNWELLLPQGSRAPPLP